MTTYHTGADAVPETAEPSLHETLRVVMRVGLLMLQSGTTNFRVSEAMDTLAAKLGIETLDTQITLNGITATAVRSNCVVTLVRESTRISLNAHRLAVLDKLVAQITAADQPDAINNRLDKVERMPPLHALPTTAIAVGLACGGFVLLNGGGFIACCVAIISAAAGQALRTILLGRRLNQLVVTAICAAFASTLYWAIARSLWWTSQGKLDDAAGFISAVLFLIPGFPLVTALLDLIRLHFTSGLTRIAYALMLLLAGSSGLGLVTGIAHLTPVLSPAPIQGGLSMFIVYALASFFSGVGFSILYNSTWHASLAIGALSITGNFVRLFLHHSGIQIAAATCIGAVVVGLAASRIGPLVEKPRIALTVPGVIVMVPGLLAYDTMTLLNRGDINAALATGVQAAFILGAIAMGLAIARILTDPAWALEDNRKNG